MTIQAAFTLLLLAATLLVMASQRLRADLVALLVLLTLVISGIVSPAEALAAFGQPVIIIVACVYVLGAALFDTGVANIIAARILRVAGRGEVALLLAIMLVAAGMSAFLDGMLVVAVLLPAVLRISRETGVSRSRLLLPLATAATLGSHLTLIGTASNLVVSDVLRASTGQPLKLLDLTPYAAVVVAAMAVWFLLPGRKLLARTMPPEPKRPTVDEVARSYGLDSQFYQLRVRATSTLIAERLGAADLRSKYRISVVAVQPKLSGRLLPASSDLVLEQDDLLFVQGQQGDVLQAASRLGLEVKGEAKLGQLAGLAEHALRLAEVMVPFRSPLAGKTLAEAGLRAERGLTVLAVQRQADTIRENLPALILAPGDTLLVEATTSRLRQLTPDPSLVQVTDLGPQPGDIVTGKARLAMGILATLVLVVVLNLLPLAVASVAAVVALVLTGCISRERAYRSVDGSVLVLIGGMLPLSLALAQTGAAGLVAGLIAGLSQTMGPLAGLLLLYLFTSLITQVIANSVAAALVTPIAISLAAAQGLSPQPFAIAMAFAVATAYVTPLTDGDNLLVREAGRYAMRDYVINGLPLFVLETVAIFAILALQL